MDNIEYSNAYSEVLEILKYISIEDYNKIPKDKIKLYKTNANNNYHFEYNPEKTLQEQNVSKITKGIVAILFRDYWATDIQRKKIINKQNYDRKLLEQEKNRKYNIDIFEKNNNHNQERKIENNALVEYKESLTRKILTFIQRIFLK